MKPGVPGLSENIEVISIIDRYLEHARIFYFHHGGDEAVFISSADWMPRNLDRRVELFVPVQDTGCRQKLLQLSIRISTTMSMRGTWKPTACIDASNPARANRSGRNKINMRQPSLR
ncbi:MAG: hypothetical protein R3C05_06080 [Pirellulaceae bacterium]